MRNWFAKLWPWLASKFVEFASWMKTAVRKAQDAAVSAKAQRDYELREAEREKWFSGPQPTRVRLIDPTSLTDSMSKEKLIDPATLDYRREVSPNGRPPYDAREVYPLSPSQVEAKRAGYEAMLAARGAEKPTRAEPPPPAPNSEHQATRDRLAEKGYEEVPMKAGPT